MFIDFIDIILFSGPFLVFGGMGQSKDSGKLTFKGLTSSDSTVNIVEDATSITFSSNSSGSPIDQYEIVYGTGTGITSSIFCVDIRSGYESITGVGVISPKLNSNLNVLSSTCNNIIIGGCDNEMTLNIGFTSTSRNNILIGGFKNCDIGATISNFGNYNSIVGGEFNIICNSNSSVIISGCKNALRGRPISNSSIISSDNSQINGSTSNSSIISSNNSVLGFTNSNTTIISSSNDPLESPYFRSSCNSMMASSYNSTLGGRSNILLSVSNSDFATNSAYSSIFSGDSSHICGSYYSSIISGSKNIIYGTTVDSKFLNRVYDSNIFAGCDNCLTAGFQEGTQSLCSAAIFSGSKNCIITQNKAQDKSSSFKGSVILGGYKNQIISATATSNNLVIGGGSNNKINYSFSNSIITNGEFNYISSGNSAILAASSSSIQTSLEKAPSSRNVIISSYNSNICNNKCVLENSVIISNECSNIKRGYNNILLSGKCNNIWIYTPPPLGKEPSGNKFRSNNSIIGGCKNGLVGGNSSILGGYKNYICVADERLNSSIIGGSCNYIVSSANGPIDSSIVGGCKNTLLDKTYSSAIIGGYNNRIFSSGGSSFNSVIVGGCGLTNSWSNSAMISNVVVRNNLFWRGITGFSGVWCCTSPFTLTASGGIITIY